MLLQAPDNLRLSPYDLQNVFVRTASGGLVPLSNVVTLTERACAQTLSREDRAPSPSARRWRRGIRSPRRWPSWKASRDVLPPEVRISYRGQSLEFKESSGALYVTFAMALLVVFLVLAAQFELFVHPFDPAVHAAGADRRADRAVGHRAVVEHLQPDRHDPVDRADGEERHPGGGIRQPACATAARRSAMRCWNHRWCGCGRS